MGPWAFSIGIMQGFSHPPIISFLTSTMSRRPEKATFIRLRSWPILFCFFFCKFPPTRATEPLIMTAAEMPFRKEAMERQSSPPFEIPSSPTPGPFT
ncbi:hypothetical protein K5549_000639 [Capra hircus]|uniref:Uncharacterized protein n=1 Tax=Capra hircus TaxID=9925 RepID=A0A452G783_CAPHI|nr:hypothetical protein K5549_000639 [Capra hircus]